MFGDKIIESFRRWRRVQSTRRELMSLSDAQLRDIGISRSDIDHTARGHNPTAA